jgi:hypothetical protein
MNNTTTTQPTAGAIAAADAIMELRQEPIFRDTREELADLIDLHTGAAALKASHAELLQIAVLLCSPHLDEAGLRETLIPMAKKAVATVRGECKNENVCREMSDCVYGCAKEIQP